MLCPIFLLFLSLASGANAFLSFNLHLGPTVEKYTVYRRYTIPLSLLTGTNDVKPQLIGPVTTITTLPQKNLTGSTTTTTTTTMTPSSTLSSDTTYSPGNLFNPPNCGLNHANRNARIVGGVESNYLQWPWMVSIEIKDPQFNHKCGGFIINNFWVLTAAHCVNNHSIDSIRLRFAEYDMSHRNELYSDFTRKLSQIISHSNFDPVTYANDIALLKLSKPIKYGPAVMPICLATDPTNLFINENATVPGWGQIMPNVISPSTVIQHTQLQVLSNLQCENKFSEKGYSDPFPKYYMCAFAKDKDSCVGDSGGPLMIQPHQVKQNTKNTKYKRWTAIGIVSWGVGCASPDLPGVYTRITEFTRWIKQILHMYT